jgi:hypothetical protein
VSIAPTGGQRSVTSSIEQGLKNLVLNAGPNVRDLSQCTRDGYRAILDAAHVPEGWPPDATASAVLTVIEELAQEIRNPRWQAATLAALRFPANEYIGADCESREGRWKALAERETTDAEDIKRRVENYRDYWRSAVPRLAEALDDRLRQLNRSPDGWRRFQDEAHVHPPLRLSQPLSFDRTEVLYQLEGYRGIQCTTWRWLTAHAPIDGYDAVGWYYNEPNAPVEIIPLANCTSDGPMRDLPMGGVLGRLRFSHVLRPDEQYFFAYVTKFNSDQPCRPTILQEVRGRATRQLTVRVQFDVKTLPSKIWYFDVGTQSEGWQTPDERASEVLEHSPNGYYEKVFDVCTSGRQYGLRWEWRDLAALA